MKNIYKDLVAIIVTWNPDALSFKASMDSYPKELQVIIVDNGSGNDFLQFFKRDLTEILNLGENHGIAYALNRGVEEASKYNPNFIVFFDQDSIIDDSYFERIFSVKETIKDREGKSLILGGLPVGREDGKPIGMYSNFDLNQQYLEVTSLYTSGMVVPYNLAKREPQNENFFIDYVDTEWCYRIRKFYSEKIFLVPSAKISHKVGDSSIDLSFFRRNPLLVHSPIRGYYQIRNAIWMLLMRHIPLCDRFKIALRCSLRVIFLTIFSYSKVLRFKFFLKGIFDGFFRKNNSHSK